MKSFEKILNKKDRIWKFAKAVGRDYIVPADVADAFDAVPEECLDNFSVWSFDGELICSAWDIIKDMMREELLCAIAVGKVKDVEKCARFAILLK